MVLSSTIMRRKFSNPHDAILCLMFRILLAILCCASALDSQSHGHAIKLIAPLTNERKYSSRRPNAESKVLAIPKAKLCRVDCFFGRLDEVFEHLRGGGDNQTEVKADEGTGEEVTAEPAELVDPQLKRQLEFYFSDSNLPKDKFLLQLTKKTPEGWVSLKTISEFKKMRDMGATVRASVLVRISVSRFENLFIKLVSRTYYQPAGGETCRRRQSI